MAIYDNQSFTLEQLRELRKLILERRASGVASLSYNGQAFTYSSPEQMWRVVEEISREIRRRMAEELGFQPVEMKGPYVTRPLATEA